MTYSYYVDNVERILYHSPFPMPNSVEISQRPTPNDTWDFDTGAWVENIEGKRNEALKYLDREFERLLKFDLSDNVAILTALPLYRKDLKAFIRNLTIASVPPPIPPVLAENLYVTS